MNTSPEPRRVIVRKRALPAPVAPATLPERVPEEDAAVVRAITLLGSLGRGTLRSQARAELAQLVGRCPNPADAKAWQGHLRALRKHRGRDSASGPVPSQGSASPKVEGACCAREPDAAAGSDSERCGQGRVCGAIPAARVALRCPADRPDAIGGPYCEGHGGAERAQREAESSWDYLAPASVGSSDEVRAAGNRRLGSEHTFVVLRELAAECGGGWEVGLGVGDDYRRLRTGLPRLKRKSGRGPLGELTSRYGDRESALAAGLSEWRSTLALKIEAVRSARGGTLAWGVPIEPRSEPVLLECPVGRSALQAMHDWLDSQAS